MRPKSSLISTLALLTTLTFLSVTLMSIPATANNVTDLPVGSQPRSVLLSPTGDRLFVSLIGSDEIKVISVATNEVLATIPVGRYPCNPGFSDDGTKYVVPNYHSMSLTVIDTTSYNILSTIDLPSSPTFVQAIPGTSSVMVSMDLLNSIMIVNLDNGAITKEITVGATPFGITPRPDGTEVFVGNFSSGSVSVVDLATQTVVRTLQLGGSPYVIRFIDNDHAVTTNHDGNTVTFFNPTDGTIGAQVQVQSQPHDIIIRPGTKEIYIPNYGQGSVYVINTDTQAVIDTIATGGSPVFGAFTPDGSKLYVADYWGNSLLEINPTDYALLPARQDGGITGVPGTGLPGIAINTGTLFVNNSAVNLDVVWPAGASELLISNDPNFTSATSAALSSSVGWNISTPTTAGSDSTVYAKFIDPQSNVIGSTYVDSIVLDQNIPIVSGAVATISAATISFSSKGVAPSLSTATYSIDTNANDDNSGIKFIEISDNPHSALSLPITYQSTINFVTSSQQSTAYIRVQDGAGNWSTTTSVQLSPSKIAVDVNAQSFSKIYAGTRVPKIGYTTSPSTVAGNWTVEPACSVFRKSDKLFLKPLAGVLKEGSYVTNCAGGQSFTHIPSRYLVGSINVIKAPEIRCNNRGKRIKSCR